MDFTPILKHITIFPVKSLDGNSLQKAQISKGGCLLHDREYAMINSEGRYINGKANPLVNTLRTLVDTEMNVISFHKEETANHATFHLQDDRFAINEYLSDYFGEEVSLLQNKEGRFLDIPDISGLTVLSTASLQTVSKWFDDMNMEETRKRFRATIEIDDVPSFWEDRLFFKEGTAIEFKIGEVTVLGISPRARCVVPTRDPETAEVIHGFPKIFAQHRAATLPEWSSLKNYGHYYHLSVDCLIPPTEIGKWIQLGDEISIVGKKKF